jgi:transporter family protein
VVTPLQLASLALAGRIVLLGFERIFVKKTGQNRDALASSSVFFLATSVLAVPLVAWRGWEWSADVWWAFATGVVYSVAFTLYVYSLSRGEASLVTPLYNLNVFFLLLLAFLFLGEAITPPKVAGLAVLVVGAGLLEPGGKLFVNYRHLASKPALAMLGTSALLAVGRTIDGTAVRGEADPIVYAAVANWVVAGYITLAAVVRGKAKAIVALARERPGPALLAGFCNFYSYALLLVAFLTFDVSVAEPASMLGSLVTIAASRFVFHERVGFRFLGALVMALGAVLLFLPADTLSAWFS